MRVFKYLKTHVAAVIVIVALLIGQAFCDLALPTYTADIVNVGIQQSGVSDAAPDAMTERTFQDVAMLSSEADEASLRASYERGDDGLYHLNDDGKHNRTALDESIALPLVAVDFALKAEENGSTDVLAGGRNAVQSDAPAAAAGGDGDVVGQGLSLAALEQAYAAGAVSKADIAGELDAMAESLGVSDDLVAQQAVAAAKDELERAGVDIGALQQAYLVRTGLAMMGFVLGSAALAVGVAFFSTRTGAAVGRELRDKLFRKVVSFSDAEVQRFSAASLITRGTNDIQQIQNMTSMLLRMVLYAPILAVGGVVMIVRTDASMGWVIVLGIVAVFAIVAVLMLVAMPKFRIMQKLIDRVNLIAREMLTGVPVVRAFGRQKLERERFDEASRDLMETQLFTNRAMIFMMPAMMLVMNGLSVLIVWVGAGYVDAGVMQPGDLIAFITYAMLIVMSFLMLGMLAIIIPRADVAAGRIDEVLKTEPSVLDDVDAEPLAAVTPGAALAFDHVSFKYGDSVGCVLDDVTFSVEPGTTCAIVGSTGSGKSTVMKLIERFHDVTEGAITLDGRDVRSIPQHDLRAQIGYVPQRAFLFSGTVATNIGYSDERMPAPGADGTDAVRWDELPADERARIEEAAQIAQASGFVEEKADGFDTAISQGGTNVSGGQRQRLAIARALARDARLYLFDDSFSALDYKTDAALRHELATRMADRTVVVVAARIASVMDADQIVVLDEGRVVGIGTHQELLDSCETYREIALSQLSEEELKGGDAA